MKQAVIRSLLRAHLELVPDLPLVRDEGTVSSAIGTATVLETELRGGTAIVVANGTTETRPLWFLTIRTPPACLLHDLDRVPDAIAETFEPGRTLTDVDATHLLVLTSLDPGALRVLPDGWGYRRITVGLTATAFRTTPSHV